MASPIMPTRLARIAAPGPFAAFIAQGADLSAGLWCIGHMAPRPCPHVHSTACGSDAVIHNATGTRATIPTWQQSQIAVTGPSTRRKCVIEATLFPEAEAVNEVSDIDYFYALRLAGEPAAVEDIHLHPALPFTLRAGVQFSR
jgi:hypothetical protein